MGSAVVGIWVVHRRAGQAIGREYQPGTEVVAQPPSPAAGQNSCNPLIRPLSVVWPMTDLLAHTSMKIWSATAGGNLVSPAVLDGGRVTRRRRPGRGRRQLSRCGTDLCGARRSVEVSAYAMDTPRIPWLAIRVGTFAVR
jgi:hypothetical protein